MKRLRTYAKVFGIGLQNTVVYRWNFLLRSAFDIVPLVGTVFLWRALFAASNKPVAGYDFSSLVCYFLFTIAASNLVTPSDDEWQIAADIRDGQINALLTKPIHYFPYRLSLFASNRLVYTLVTAPCILLIFAWFHSYLRFPAHGVTWLIAGCSLALAALMQFLIAYAVAMMAFWILEISTIAFILFSFEYFLSGYLFPLDLLPPWMHAATNWLPFTYELYFPIAIFEEKVTGFALVRGLATQLGWILIIGSIGRVMWHRGLRKFGAYGG